MSQNNCSYCKRFYNECICDMNFSASGTVVDPMRYSISIANLTPFQAIQANSPTLTQSYYTTLLTRMKSLNDYSYQLSKLVKTYISKLEASLKISLSSLNEELKLCTTLLKTRQFSENEKARLDYYISNPLPQISAECPALDRNFQDLLTSFKISPFTVNSGLMSQNNAFKMMIDLGLNVMSHTGGINSISISRDERIVVTGGNDKSIKIWLTEPLKLLRTISECGSIVNSVVISSDNSFVVSCTVDGKVQMWDLGNGKKIRDLPGQEDLVTSLALSLDNLILLSGSKDKTIAVHRLYEYGSSPWILVGNEQTVMAVNFAKDYTKVISGSSDTTVRVFNIYTCSLEQTFRGHTKKVTSVLSLPDPDQIASSSEDGTIRIWSLFQQDQIHKLEISQKEITSLSQSSNFSLLSACTIDGFISIISLSSLKQIGKLSGHTRFVNGSIFMDTRGTLLSVSADRSIRCWSLESFKEILCFPGHTDVIKLCTFDSNQVLMVTFAGDNLLLFWEVASGIQIGSLKYTGGELKDLALSPDCLYLFTKPKEASSKMWVVSVLSFTKVKEVVTQEDHQGWKMTYPSMSRFFA